MLSFKQYIIEGRRPGKFDPSKHVDAYHKFLKGEDMNLNNSGYNIAPDGSIKRSPIHVMFNTTNGKIHPEIRKQYEEKYGDKALPDKNFDWSSYRKGRPTAEPPLKFDHTQKWVGDAIKEHIKNNPNATVNSLYDHITSHENFPEEEVDNTHEGKSYIRKSVNQWVSHHFPEHTDETFNFTNFKNNLINSK